MLKENQYIGVLEKILTHLKNSKLAYFKASDHAVSAEKKRFFNQQGLIRNRFFQDVLTELQRLGMSSDEGLKKNAIASAPAGNRPVVETLRETDHRRNRNRKETGMKRK